MPTLGAAEFQREVAQLAVDYAPRRFAIIEEEREEGRQVDAYVLAWGMAWPDHAVVCDDDGFMARRFTSGSGALRSGGPADRLHLIWIDEAADPAPQ